MPKLICSALFGFTLNSINQILDEMQKHAENYKEEKRIIVNYMQKRGLSNEVLHS
jgi:hypothetical protein